MQNKSVGAVLALLLGLLLLLPAGSALAHSGEVKQGRGTYSMEPAVPVAGQPVQVIVRPTDDDGHPLTGGKLTGEFTRAGESPLPGIFREKEPGVYVATITFAEKDWHGSLRYENGETRLVSNLGFTVFTDGNVRLGAVVNRVLDWRAAGVAAAPPWTDTATWVLLIAATVAAALGLLARQGAGAAELKLAPARKLLPSGLLTLGLVGALAMPASGLWDISWHMDLGRDGLLSPPHLGIYGGIITSLLAVGAGVVKGGGIRKIKEFPALAFTIGAMVVELASAPLDEIWHRVMGLDISVWAPPHNMLIFGAALSMIGLAAIQAAADPRAESLAARIRIVGFGAAALFVLNDFLAEFEFADIPLWHVSQARPPVLYPLLLGLFTVIAGATVARLTSMRWAATRTALVWWGLRSLQTLFFLPAIGRKQPHLAAIAVLVGAVALDLALQYAQDVGRGRYRYAFAGAVGALATFVAYPALAGVLPVLVVPAAQLAAWLPVAMAASAAGGYLAGWLGDYVLTVPVADPLSLSIPGNNFMNHWTGTP